MGSKLDKLNQRSRRLQCPSPPGSMGRVTLNRGLCLGVTPSQSMVPLAPIRQRSSSVYVTPHGSRAGVRADGKGGYRMYVSSDDVDVHSGGDGDGVCDAVDGVCDAVVVAGVVVVAGHDLGFCDCKFW